MKTSMLLASILMLVACGSGSSDDTPQRVDTVGTEIANDYNKAMDKARNVETLSFENKDRMDAALDEAEGESRNNP